MMPPQETLELMRIYENLVNELIRAVNKQEHSKVPLIMAESMIHSRDWAKHHGYYMDIRLEL